MAKQKIIRAILGCACILSVCSSPTVGRADYGGYGGSGLGAGIGLMCGSLVTAVARNPSLQSQLEAQFEVNLKAVTDAAPRYALPDREVGIANACAGLLEATARNPSLTGEFTTILETDCKPALSEIPTSDADIAAALAIVSAAYSQAYARNPSLQTQLMAAQEKCFDVIKSGDNRIDWGFAD